MRLFYAFLSLLIFLFIDCGDDGAKPANQSPVIQSVTADPDTVNISEAVNLQCVASDPNNDILVYTWSAQHGTFPNGPAGSVALWLAPGDTGTYQVTVSVSDGQLTDNETINIKVALLPNHAPVIQNLSANPSIVLPDGITQLACDADDEDEDPLTFAWSSDEGSFPGGTSGDSVQWQAPYLLGEYYVRVIVSDGRDSVRDSILITVDEPPSMLSNPDPPY